MSSDKVSGQAPFVFTHREDLSNLPAAAKQYEVNLHGGFAIDARDGHGQIYYGMPGCGIMRVDADLQKQTIINLPDELTPLNFHSTKIGEFDGKRRLFLAANNDKRVVILSLSGEVDFILPRPVFDEYQAQEAPYKPTDTVLVGNQLYIADGYGSNYITCANITTQQWTGIFGGKTDNPAENGKFATAHGINLNPIHHHLDIADRPHSRIQVHDKAGHFVASHKLPSGAFLCGISYLAYQARWYAVIGCLRDPQESRPAPIYIIDAESYELLSTIRPKEELGIELAQHLHNVVFHIQDDQLYLVCQAWNPGHYFVLQKETLHELPHTWHDRR
jgi:hypothetical protein